MRRLTLILSDLYLPEEAMAGEVPQTQQLPALEWLLRFASPPLRIRDWRRWLLQQLGSDLAEHRIAAVSAAGTLSASGLESAWLATPVALEARLDHVRLAERGLLSLDAAERMSVCTEFNRVFGPQHSLSECGERAFLLGGVAPLVASVADPARYLGAQIGPALAGADASELRRLSAEIEMWLHGSALNRERERLGRRPISALWLWGGDRAGAVSNTQVDLAIEFYGGDPLMRGLARMRRTAPRDPPPALVQAWPAPHLVAEFAAMSGRAPESLSALDSNWFAAARDMLAADKLSSLEIVANDLCFTITPRARWRWWRRRRNWLEMLAHPSPKA